MLLSLRDLALVALATAAQAHNERGSACNENTYPRQIRVAYAGTNGMAVSWNTKQKLSRPTVNFGYEHGWLSRSASSDISITYPTSSTWNNHVTINGLTPNTKYHYLPECGNETYSFTTARAVGHGEPYKFAMVGDMGTMGKDGLSTTVGKGGANPLAPGDKNTIQSLTAQKPEFDFVWHGPSPIPSVATRTDAL
jgi:hypothetical protein